VSARETGALGATPCANTDCADCRPPGLAEADAATETPDSQPLTRCEASFNASAPHCQYCDKPIPPHRVIAARRTKVEARWCSASCRVKGCIAKKRDPS
jgi:hypothetical protein